MHVHTYVHMYMCTQTQTKTHVCATQTVTHINFGYAILEALMMRPNVIDPKVYYLTVVKYLQENFSSTLENCESLAQ